MTRKARRLETVQVEVERQQPLPRRAPARRPTQANFTDESQYTHVRSDLIRIAILAFSLFAALILLRVVTTALGIFL